MDEAQLGFQPMRVDRGDSVTVVVGSMGELVRVNGRGVPMHQPVTPFPASVTEGAVLDGIWVGTWVEHEMQQARMAALPLDGEWVTGAGRDALRQRAEPAGLMPSSSMWSRFLDAEPMAVSGVEGGLVFATLRRGIYKIGFDATELWRAPYPEWPQLSGLKPRDHMVSSNEVDGSVAIWSAAGGVCVLDIEDGSQVLSTTISLPDTLSGVRHSEDGGWLLLLNSGGTALLDELESEPSVIGTPGPGPDATCEGGRWKWTGWRHDGVLRGGVAHCTARGQIGVGLLADRVLTNDGVWSDHARAHSSGTSLPR